MKRQTASVWSRPAGLASACGVIAVMGWLLSGGVLAGGAGDAEKPDPVKANGAIFKTTDGGDWPKPDAVLLFTGEQEGYLEPCGCAGLTNMKGGLKRRHTFLKELRGDGWPVLALDTGGLVKRFGQQGQLKYEKAVQALETMGYAGVGFGEKDLKMDVLGIAINLDPEKNPLTSANIGLLGFDPTMSKRWRVQEVGDLRIGFTSVLADSGMKGLADNPDIDTLPAVKALKEVTADLEEQQCDQLALLVYGSGDEARKLAAEFPQYTWIVSARGADEPPYQAEKLPGDQYLIETGHKGMYGIAIGLYRGEGGEAEAGGLGFRYQKVPFDHRFEDSPEMQQLMVNYQEELRAFGYDGLGVKPQLHPSAEITKSQYAGSKTCEDCHYEEYEIWANSPHAHATDSIVDLEPARHFDPECISCHVTGWEPQKYHPFANGWVNLETTANLDQQGCENCHGPAARHAAAQSGDIEVTDEELEALNQALHLEIVENEGNKEGQEFAGGKVVQTCMQCHDLDNSPDFDFQAYWQVVKHGERWPRDEEDDDE
ncbi:MAG: multiheme c-type cytochrome [Planctomycetota bacterium]